MSDALSVKRAALRDAVAQDGVRVYSVLPDRLVPPFIFVAPADPYLDFDGAMFGGVIAHFRVGCVVGRGTNDERANEVDELALKTLIAIDSSDEGFAVESVAQPGAMQIGQQTHLTAVLNVWCEIRP